MTATSVLDHIDPASTVRAWLRFAAAIVVIAVLTIGAFAIGRATSTATTIRPASVPVKVAPVTPTPAASTYRCRSGRPC